MGTLGPARTRKERAAWGSPGWESVRDGIVAGTSHHVLGVLMAPSLGPSVNLGPLGHALPLEVWALLGPQPRDGLGRSLLSPGSPTASQPWAWWPSALGMHLFCPPQRLGFFVCWLGAQAFVSCSVKLVWGWRLGSAQGRKGRTMASLWETPQAKTSRAKLTSSTAHTALLEPQLWGVTMLRVCCISSLWSHGPDGASQTLQLAPRNLRG